MSNTEQYQFNEVVVLDKYGFQISKCSKKRAHQLITRKAAVWYDYYAIKLLYDYNDKKRFKQQAMERDNWTCYICSKIMHPTHAELTADHIISRSKGGTDYPENIACCCKNCNNQKGNMDLEDYLQSLQENNST